MRKLSLLLSFLSIPFLASGAPAASVALDSASAECVRCHESSVSTGPTVTTGGHHPIGLDYAVAAARNRGLVSPESLPSSIRLSDGRLGCLSCHVPYTDAHEKAQDQLLSVDNDGSGLCSTCHIK